MIEQAIDESLELSVHDKQISVAMCGSSATRPDTPLLGCIAPTADGNSVRPFRVSQFGFTLRACVSLKVDRFTAVARWMPRGLPPGQFTQPS